jgi:hypothetical protein
MGTKNLSYPDFDSPAIHNPNFFIPVDVDLLDSKEAVRFERYYQEIIKPQLQQKNIKSLYTENTDYSRYFKKTRENISNFLKPLGLAVGNITTFFSPPTQDINDTKNIHVDSAGESMLEARLSIYSMADSPGIVRWFDPGDDLLHLHQHIWQNNWIKEMREGKRSWEDCPDYVFATPTNCSTAFIRTNWPHHVIQGPGKRITISAQVFLEDMNPKGAWKTITERMV